MEGHVPRTRSGYTGAFFIKCTKQNSQAPLVLAIFIKMNSYLLHEGWMSMKAKMTVPAFGKQTFLYNSTTVKSKLSNLHM